MKLMVFCNIWDKWYWTVIQAEGKTIYHAGDTADFSDLALLKEQFSIDVAFLPIGDNYTMVLEDVV